MDFQISPQFERWHVFTGRFERFKQIFWKTETFFKKLEYRFLVESTNVENAIFQYKVGLSRTNVKTNSMGSVNWTYHKEQSCSSKYFIVLKMLI